MTQKIHLTVNYLQMFDPPDGEPVSAPTGAQVIQAVQPTASFYRYLYNHVGEEWLWYERRAFANDKLLKLIRHPDVAIYVLYQEGVPAGYCELNGRSSPDIEILYFGLLPDFIGRGLGKFFLDWTVRQAWQNNPRRVWLHTCSLDHPRALAVYQKAGFTLYKTETEWIDQPVLTV